MKIGLSKLAERRRSVASLGLVSLGAAIFDPFKMQNFAIFSIYTKN